MIKLAIIGLGKWGQELVKSVNSKSKVVKFTSVISRNPEKIIKETNASSIKDMGSVMSKLKRDYAGRCDFSLVAKIAREKLG